MRRLVTLLGVLATFGTAAACNPITPALELSNPRDILSRTIETTAGLQSMRVRVDLEIRDRARPADPQGGSAEAALDLGAGEMSVTAVLRDGSDAFAYIQADGATFVRSSSNGRWTKFPAVGGMAALFLMGGLGGVQPDARPVLVDLLDDVETAVELIGVEDCATGRCYRTAVRLPPAQVWKLLVELTGIDRMQGGDPIEPPLDQIPPLVLDVFTDKATLRLVELVASAALDGTTVAVRIRVAAPNEPVSINAPPAELVDQGNPGFGIGGGGVAPVPPQPVTQPIPPASVESPRP